MIQLGAVPAFLAIAAALGASMIPGAILFSGMKHGAVIYFALAQGVLYAVFAWALLRCKDRLSAVEIRRYTAYLFGIAVLMRALILFAPPLSTDVFRYIWDGRVQAEGINPYRHIPADPALAHLRDSEIYPNVNRRDYAPTIYPPGAQAIYFAVTRLSESVTMMKAAMLAFEGIAAWALVQLLAARGLPVIFASLYLLHPLAVWEIAGSGHIDIAAVAFVFLALLAAEKGQRFASGGALAAGVLTKYFPLALTPALYKRWDWRMPAAFATTALALYLPYLAAGSKILGFLGGYAGEELRAGDGLYLAALFKLAGLGEAALPAFLGVAALILFALAWRTGFRAEPEKPDLGGAFSIAVAFTVLFSPHYAWYFLWLVPFLCFFPRPSVFWLTLSAPLLYRAGWPLGLLANSVQYIPFAVLLALEYLSLTYPKEAPDEPAAA
jgi:alpha-1,6-mannosyltransferase